MNDTVATEGQEQPAACHERKARSDDRDLGYRTSSRPADIYSAPTGRTYDRSRPNRSQRQKSACQGRPSTYGMMWRPKCRPRTEARRRHHLDRDRRGNRLVANPRLTRRRDRRESRAGRPRGASRRSRWLAHVSSARRAMEYHHPAATAQMPRARDVDIGGGGRHIRCSLRAIRAARRRSIR
jgi:hypothetical protein